MALTLPPLEPNDISVCVPGVASIVLFAILNVLPTLSNVLFATVTVAVAPAP